MILRYFSAYDCTVQNDKFLCGDNVTCISLDRVCNGVNGTYESSVAFHSQAALIKNYSHFFPIDCADSADERNECFKNNQKNGTNSCSKYDCLPTGKCHVLPTGPTCICPKGYKLSENKQECEVMIESLNRNKNAKLKLRSIF